MFTVVAKRDIDLENLKVRAGRVLPERFQSRLGFRALQESLGPGSIVGIDTQTEGYVFVEAKHLAALEAEIQRLTDENAQLLEAATKPSAKAGGDKRARQES